MFRTNKSSAPKSKKTLKRKLGTTAMLCAGMATFYVIGKREDAKIKNIIVP